MVQINFAPLSKEKVYIFTFLIKQSKHVPIRNFSSIIHFEKPPRQRKFGVHTTSGTLKFRCKLSYKRSMQNQLRTRTVIKRPCGAALLSGLYSLHIKLGFSHMDKSQWLQSQQLILIKYSWHRAAQLARMQCKFHSSSIIYPGCTATLAMSPFRNNS